MMHVKSTPLRVYGDLTVHHFLTYVVGVLELLVTFLGK